MLAGLIFTAAVLLAVVGLPLAIWAAQGCPHADDNHYPDRRR